jgi:membrane protease YdiL (CAAX protease family)
MPIDPEPRTTGWDAAFLLFLLFVIIASITAWVRLVRRLRAGRPAFPPAEPPGAAPTPGRRPWPTSAFLLTLLLFLGVEIALGFIFLDVRPGASPAPPPPRLSLWLATARNLALILLVPALTYLTARIGPDALGLGRSRHLAADVRAGIGLILVLLPVAYGVMIAVAHFDPPRAHPLQESIQQFGAADSLWLSVVTAVLDAPAAEELLFRGVLLGWLITLALEGERRRGAWAPGQPAPPRAFWVPNILSSWLFAAMHAMQWPAPIPLFLVSLGLGWLAQHTGRLVAPIVAHSAFNAFGTAMALLAAQAQAARDLPAPVPVPVPAPAIARPA